jgi:hypothetical protein
MECVILRKICSWCISSGREIFACFRKQGEVSNTTTTTTTTTTNNNNNNNNRKTNKHNNKLK